MIRARRTLGAAVISVAAIAGLAATGLTPATASSGSDWIVIEDGVTQPVFDYDDAIQEVVYVEAPMDSDSDGANDLIAVDVIRPVETEQGMTVPTIMEASPYYGRSANPAPDQTRGFPGWWDDGTPAVASWSTGNVGMQGVSYVGTLPNAVATQGIDGLRTVVPIAAISSWYRYVNDQGVAWSRWSENLDFRYTEWLGGVRAGQP